LKQIGHKELQLELVFHPFIFCKFSKFKILLWTIYKIGILVSKYIKVNQYDPVQTIFFARTALTPFVQNILKRGRGWWGLWRMECLYNILQDDFKYVVLSLRCFIVSESYSLRGLINMFQCEREHQLSLEIMIVMACMSQTSLMYQLGEMNTLGYLWYHFLG
jgi:hypothetical protein